DALQLRRVAEFPGTLRGRRTAIRSGDCFESKLRQSTRFTVIGANADAGVQSHRPARGTARVYTEQCRSLASALRARQGTRGSQESGCRVSSFGYSESSSQSRTAL